MAESRVTASSRSLKTSLSNQLGNFRYPKAPIELLRYKLGNLQRRMEEITSNVVIVNNNAQVDDWLKEAESVEKEAGILLGGSINSKMSCYSSFKCCGSKLRNSVEKKVEMTASKISKLLKDLHTSSDAPPPPSVNFLESRVSIKTEIIETLNDNSVSMIGVCGLVGVGKTTTIATVSLEVKEKNFFNEVLRVVVPQNPNIMEIQDQLAAMLNLSLQIVETTEARAEKLNRRLNEPKILVILEDIWEELDLSTIGIRGKWPKVILTSRQLNVCRTMGAKKIVQVEPLSETEAWSLFEQVADISQDAPEGIKDIAKIMANKCNGLPLLICGTGSQLRGEIKEDTWRESLQHFSSDQDKFGLIKQMHLSYNHLLLESKAVLLICWSLFPEDCEIWIEDLARYAKGLQVFKSIDTLLETREKLASIINILIDLFLLLKCGNDRVKLHGVVRIYCLSIASAHKDVTMTSHEKLIRIPKDENEYCAAISLCITIPDQAYSLMNQLQSSELHLLRLSSHGQGSSISTRDFLQGMEKLEVLDIQSIGLETPVSLNSLMSVRTLSLNYCRLEDLSEIASLQKLEILSFYGSTYVGKFPNEIGELIRLKSLDLRFLKGPSNKLPSGILDKFQELEELYLGSSPPGDIIAEVGSLSHLNTIQVLLNNDYELTQLLEILDVDKLKRFWIVVGPFKGVMPYHFVGRLVVKEVNVTILWEMKMKQLVKRCVEELVLRRIKGIVKDFADKGNGFQELKELKLKECDVKYLGDSTTPGSDAFVELEKLCIRRAENLEGLYPKKFPPNSFYKLRELQIEGGKAIRSLFFPSFVNHLQQLQIIKITDCPKLEAIISSDDQAGEDIAQFPKLEEVYLTGVGSFRRFYSDLEGDVSRRRILSLPKLRCMRISGSERIPMVFEFEGLGEHEQRLFDQLISLHVSDLPNLKHLWGTLPKGTVAFHNLETIVVEKCRGLKYLLTPSMANVLVSLRSLKVICCQQMEVIIGKPETKTEDDIQATTLEIVEEENYIQLKKLSHIELFDLPMLRMLCSQPMKLSFPSLNEFCVAFCPRIRNWEGTLSAPELKEVDCLPYSTVPIHTMSDYFKKCEDEKKCLTCAIRNIKCDHHLDEEESTSYEIRNNDMGGHLDEEASSRTTRLFVEARKLYIAWGDNSQYWEWLPINETNKTEIARLEKVWWLDVRATVNTKLLIKRTDYTAYLVYDLEDHAWGLDEATASVRYSHQMLHVDEYVYDSTFTVFLMKKKKTLRSDEPFATTRADGHLEIALGQFHTRTIGSNDRGVEIGLFSKDCWKCGIQVLGVEVRSD